jgi:medium-chain acyl-[acyl-carrier-protein] hydrolase
VKALAAAIAAEFSYWTDRPYGIYGHSVGALMAFEVVRELRTAGAAAPVHFFAGASRAPHLPPPQPLLHALPDHEFLEEVHRRYDSVPRQIFEDTDVRELVLPALRADVTAFETYDYVASSPMNCPVTVFGGAGDSLVRGAALDAWRVHTSAEFELEMMPGGHIFVLTALGRLLASISRRMQNPAWRDISKGAGKPC